MDTNKICAKLEDVTYVVNTFIGNEPLNPETCIATGTGATINSRGDLLTAAHVVTGRTPIRQEDVNDPSVIIVARNSRGSFVQYYSILFAPTLNNPLIKKPLSIDLAILRPVIPQSNIPYLRIKRSSVQVGTKVLMAGFPDDVELPFSLDRHLDLRSAEVQSLLPNIRIAQQLLMIKSGMVGHRNTAVLFDGTLTLEVEVFYVDNQMHSGASGGPVVDQNAEIVGVISQRAITSVPFGETPNLKVPSGSTVAISPRVIQSSLDKQGEQK